MYNWMTKWIRRIVDAFDVAENREGYNLNDPATLARVRQETKDQIHKMRLDATLAQLCAESIGSCNSWTPNPENNREALFLFAQADRLERELLYGSLRVI